MEIPSQTLRTCTKCGVTKSEDEFYLLSKDNRIKHNRKRVAAACKECTKKFTRSNLENIKGDPERLPEHERKVKLYCKRRHDNRRDQVFAAYGGYKCACCGETEPAFLSLDHVNNDGAEWRRERFGNRMAAGYHTYKWLINHGFPPGFQVLCMNCQHGKRMRGGVCPHQRRSNDYPQVGVGSSDPKRTAPEQSGEDIVCSAVKIAAAS